MAFDPWTTQHIEDALGFLVSEHGFRRVTLIHYFIGYRYVKDRCGVDVGTDSDFQGTPLSCRVRLLVDDHPSTQQDVYPRTEYPRLLEIVSAERGIDWTVPLVRIMEKDEWRREFPAAIAAFGSKVRRVIDVLTSPPYSNSPPAR